MAYWAKQVVADRAHTRADREGIDLVQLGIVIPTFNERDNVRVMVNRIAAALKGSGISYEAWFIDDSTDDTPEVLAQLADSDPCVHFVHREHGNGLATAVVEGFERTKADYLVVMDADLQHPPELLPVLLERMQEGIDVVIPSRFVPGGSDGGLSPLRKLVSWTARAIGRISLKRLRHISDCTGGFFGVRRSVIEGVQLSPIGWKILMEVLIKGHYESVHEIPYQFVDRRAGVSKMSIKEQWNYMRHVIRLVSGSPDDRRFYLFCFVGALGVVVNLVAMLILNHGLHMNDLAASVIASLIAMGHNFLWNDNVTWRGHVQTVKWKRALQVPTFMAISGISLAVTTLFMKVVVWLHGDAVLGQFIGIVVSTVWSYMANNKWTWKPPQTRTAEIRPIRVTHEIRVPHEDVRSS